jgi:hypothetical protein
MQYALRAVSANSPRFIGRERELARFLLAAEPQVRGFDVGAL